MSLFTREQQTQKCLLMGCFVKKTMPFLSLHSFVGAGNKRGGKSLGKSSNLTNISCMMQSAIIVDFSA